MPWKDFRKISRGEFGCECDSRNEHTHRYKQVNTGSLLRIADSLERIEKPCLKLIKDVEHLDRTNRERLAGIDRLRKQNARLKGEITKLKKRIAEMEANK